MSGPPPQARALDPARVLLMGMMGSGKTTVGTVLSRLTGWPYLDNDELVRLGAGIKTPDVLTGGGVLALRSEERRALLAALTSPAPCIAAVAAGVVENDEDLEALRGGGFVVWLRARIDTLVARVGTGAGRPFLQPDPRAALERLYAGREERYRRAASLIVDVDDVPPDQVAGAILDGLRGSAD